MTDPRIVNLAKILVQYSTEIQPKETVMIWGFPLETTGTPLVREIYRQVLRAGGYPFTYILPDGIRYLMYHEANDDQLTYIDPIVKLTAETFDVDIRITSLANTRSLTNIDPEKQVLRSRAFAKVMKTMGERTARGEHRWVVSRFPSHSMAQEAEMCLEEYEDFVYSSTFADQEDPVELWQAVERKQARIVDWLKGKKEVVLHGPDIDLTLSIEGRTFINCCGKRNLPDGEIYTGPVEESANGWVRFSFPAITLGREIKGVELTFREGRVVEAKAEKNEAYLNSRLDTDAGSRYIGELGIGTNTQIDRFTRSMLFDEKIGGTIHLALGAGFKTTGSKNESAIHWDMLCDMRNGGQIIVDGELFYESGKFKI